MAISISFVKIPEDGEKQDKGANMDPVTWKAVQMVSDPSKFKIIDDNNPPINVAHLFNSQATAQQFIDHQLWIKNNPCPQGQVHDPMTGICKTFVVESQGFFGNFGNQFIRNMSGKSAGCVEINSKGKPNSSSKLGPANAIIHFIAGIPVDMKGMKGNRKSKNSDEITLIFKENHAATEAFGRGDKGGKHNVKVTLEYEGKNDDKGTDARYTGKVELAVEDDHDKDKNPKQLRNVDYKNTDVLTKYTPGGDPIRAKGSYQDTKDGGVRFRLEIEDPVTKEWKEIFNHVDKGDNNHDIHNYRGASAYCSAMRIDGHVDGFDDGGQDHVKEILRPLHFKPISTDKTEEQKRLLFKLAYGSIRIEEIQPEQ